MSNETKASESLLHDLEFTSKNYINMKDRLHLRQKMTNFFIVYYSVFAVVFSLIPVFFKEVYISSVLISFISVIASIVILVVSLMVSLANYSNRISKTVFAIDGLKKIKKQLQMYSEEALTEDGYKLYKQFIDDYHKIVDEMELRSDVDYYRTCCQIEKLDRLTIWQKIIGFIEFVGERLLYVALFISPIIILLVLAK